MLVTGNKKNVCCRHIIRAVQTVGPRIHGMILPSRQGQTIKNSGENVMKIVMISDTHERRPEVPDGDVLIHAGDLTMSGKLSYLIEEMEWMKSLPHPYKI